MIYQTDPLLDLTETQTRVIGALLTITHDSNLGYYLDKLSGKMFTDIQDRYTFEAIKNLYITGKPVTFTGVIADLASKNLSLDSQKIGAYKYEYTDSFFLDQDIETLINAKTVADVKKLIPALSEFVKNPFGDDDSGSIISRIGELKNSFLTIGQEYIDYGDSACDLLAQLILDQDSPIDARVTTGYDDFDKLIHGLGGGSLNVFAARPGVGKTTAALDIARSICFTQQKKCAFFSLEMPKKELIQKITSAQLSIPLEAFIAKTLTQEQKDLSVMFKKEYQEALNNLTIFDDSSITIDLLELKIPAIVREKNVAAVIIDYVQLIGSAERNRRQSRTEQIQDITRRLKKLAKNTDTPIIGLAQLNRGIESRTSKTPLLSDIRESGAIEQDADLVVMLHRGEEENASKTFLTIVKNRHGKLGEVSLLNNLEYSRFTTDVYASLSETVGDNTVKFGNGKSSYTTTSNTPWSSK